MKDPVVSGGRVSSRANPELLHRVLDAADSCFGEFGVDRTTMEHVAQASGLSRGLIYKYLGDRDGVVLAVLERRARVFNATAAAFLQAQPSFEDALVEGILLAVRLAHSDTRFGVLVAAASLDRERRLVGAAELARQLTNDLWRPVLEAAVVRDEVVAGINVDDLIDWITYLELALLAGREAAGTTEADQARHLRTLFIPAVVRGNRLLTKESA